MSEKAEAFHALVVKPIARFIADHPEDAAVIHLRVLLIVALAYEDHLDGGRRVDGLLKAVAL